MTDEKFKALAEIVLSQDEIIHQLILSLNEFREKVLPILFQNEVTLQMAHRFEVMEANAERAIAGRERARIYFVLPIESKTPPSVDGGV